MDNSDLILSELRDLRKECNASAISTGERLASLETSMTSLVGNGQPGRITLLERGVERLQQWRWKLVGVAGGVAGVVSAVAWILKG
jgi:hypothetical protein